jgi:hypothetical protein
MYNPRAGAEKGPQRGARGAWGGAPFLWLALVAAGLLFGGFLLLQQQSERGVLEPEYSTYRTDPKGCKALYLTLENMGQRVARWNQDFTGLPPGILFILAPPKTEGPGVNFQSGDIQPYEIRKLDDWVKQGNTVVVMSAEKNLLYEALGIFPSLPKSPAAAAAQPGRLTDGVKELGLSAGRAFRFGREKPSPTLFRPEPQDAPPSPITEVATNEWLPLFGSSADPVVVVAARGRGQYITVADVYPASNLGLALPNNRRFMANLASLAGGGTVIFDEAHHRDIGRGFMAYARARRLTPFIVCLLGLIALGIWRSGVRFGLPVPLAAREQRDSGEYVQAVAALYQSAGMGRDALAANYEQFKRRAAAWLRLGSAWRADLVAQRFQARIAPRAHPSGREIWQTLNDVEAALTKGQVLPAEAFALVSRLAALEKEIP